MKRVCPIRICVLQWESKLTIKKNIGSIRLMNVFMVGLILKRKKLFRSMIDVAVSS